MNLEVIDCLQGSNEWHQARAGWVTCSELSKVMAKSADMKMRRGYMRQLAAEILTGKPASSFKGNVYTEMGKELEPIARDLLAEELGQPITETGILREHDIGLSCSPDGLIEHDDMAEFKCCLPTTQIERLERGTLPPEYVLQVQGSLLATGRKRCWFQSYSPDLPRLVVPVLPDLELHEKITVEVRAFREELAALVSRIRGKY